MRAVVLVGGFGTRLRPLTLDVPKQMLPVVGATMLERVVGRLAEHGVDEVVLSLGYRPDVFTEAFPEGHCAGATIRYAVEPEPLDTGGAIAFAAREAGIDETFLALNGDVLTDMDLDELVARHRSTGARGTISLTPVDDPSRYGVVPTGDDGRVIEFVEKPATGTAPSNWINAGTYVLEASVLDLVTPGAKVSIEREVFPQLAADGDLSVQSDAYWIDAGTPDAYLRANLDLLSGARGTPVGGISAAASVHPAATIAESAIGAEAKVGAGATVERSVVMAGAIVEDGATLTDSVIGGRATIGAGAILTRTLVGFDRNVDSGTELIERRVPPPEEWGMKTLVTGGAGFIGSNLVDRLLAEGHAVDVIDDLSSGKLANLADAGAGRDHELTFHQLDICAQGCVDMIQRRRPDVVFHLAAQIDVRASVDDPAHDARVNVLGALNVLEGARRAGARKLVFASSGGTIYGDVDVADLPVTEAQPLRPAVPYGVSKRVFTDYLAVFRELYGLEYTSLAFANVYGPRQDPHGEAGVVSIFAGKLLSGEPPTIFGTGEQTRDFVYVDDVVDSLVRAIDRGDGLLMNIGTGRETSVNHFYASMAKAIGFKEPAIHAALRPGEVERSCLDATRAKIQLGWEAWTDIDTGSAAVMEWERARRA